MIRSVNILNGVYVGSMFDHIGDYDQLFKEINAARTELAKHIAEYGSLTFAIFDENGQEVYRENTYGSGFQGDKYEVNVDKTPGSPDAHVKS